MALESHFSHDRHPSGHSREARGGAAGSGADARERIAAGLAEADRGGGAVILTDMFGGTPTNLALPFLKKDHVEIVTGVNLPMVLKCASLQGSGKPVAEIARLARDRGQRSICVASDLLASEESAATAASESRER